MQEIAIFWFRRDLRFEDNHGFYQALCSGLKVLPVFIFDKDILDALEDRNDRRVNFIYYHISQLHRHFSSFQSGFYVKYGTPLNVFVELIGQFKVKAIYTNHDYEPYAIQRDTNVADFMKKHGIEFYSFKDQVIYEKSDVVKADGTPYNVFTPYSKVWKKKLSLEGVSNFASENLLERLHPIKTELPSLDLIGFELSPIDDAWDIQWNEEIIMNYHNTRNIPSNVNGTSRLGVHLRFGTISIRKMVQQAVKLNETWLNELIWREFFMQILYHYPRVVEQSFKVKYDQIPWRNSENEFSLWCQGKTGYPIVDAGMRELNKTGFMHNRVRMIVASFLTKHLLIDWRWGETYFASKLMDYELSANNGNWQWAAGTGCDAAPYFRVFNPSEQAKKFDPNASYINKWLSPIDLMLPPMVEHSFARNRALEVYKKALNNG